MENTKEEIIGKETSKIEWTRVKDSIVGAIDDKLVCIIEKVDGLPCVAYTCQPLINCFTNADSAMIEAERLYEFHKDHRKEDHRKGILEIMAPMAKTVLEQIAKMEEKG